MSKPPPLPTDTLARVLRVAVIDGRVLVFIAGGFALVSAATSDWLGAATGGLAAGAGWMELHGRRKLKASDARGVDWLVRSQLALLAVILGYVAYQYFNYDPMPQIARLEPMLREFQQAQGMEPVSLAESLDFSQRDFEAFVRKIIKNGYIGVGVASVLFQGGLAFYYHSTRAKIALALRKS